MTVTFLNTPHWQPAYTLAMLTALSTSDLTLDEAIGVYSCGNEL